MRSSREAVQAEETAAQRTDAGQGVRGRPEWPAGSNGPALQHSAEEFELPFVRMARACEEDTPLAGWGGAGGSEQPTEKGRLGVGRTEVGAQQGAREPGSGGEGARVRGKRGSPLEGRPEPLEDVRARRLGGRSGRGGRALLSPADGKVSRTLGAGPLGRRPAASGNAQGLLCWKPRACPAVPAGKEHGGEDPEGTWRPFSQLENTHVGHWGVWKRT